MKVFNAYGTPKEISQLEIIKSTISLTASGSVLTPSTDKQLKIYSVRFSLTSDVDDVSFRFSSTGTDFEKYISVKSGGLYGSNNHPNYILGNANEPLYCSTSTTGAIQINCDYIEI